MTGSIHSRRPRVLLVSLPFRYFPKARTQHRNYVRPPLGIASLAGYLREHASSEMEVLCCDLLVEGLLDLSSVRDRLLQIAPDVIGFSVTTATVTFASRIAVELKRVRPDLVLVAGGPHITALADEPLPGFDAKIVGEGEASLLEYIRSSVLGGRRDDIDGVRRVQPDGTVLPGRPRALLPDLDALPFAAIDLLPGAPYFHSFPYPNVHRFMTMMTSRGCPYDCNFCGSRGLWGPKVRRMSAERVLAEVDWLTGANKVDLLFFEDDTFTADRARLVEILARFRRKHPGLRWICHTRADLLDRDLVREMAASGCVEAQVGIESGDEEVLAQTSKGLDLETAYASVDLLKQAGISVWATFVLGHENETAQTLQRTLDAAIRLDPTYASFILLLPFPGTRVFERFQSRGFLKTRDWEDYSWHGDPVFETDLISSEDLVRFRSKANLRFYCRPTKLARLGWTMLRAGSSKEMVRNLIAWMSMVGQGREKS